MEDGIISLSEELDYELIENMEDVTQYDKDYLHGYKKHFFTLFSRAIEFNSCYKSFFIFGSDDHPDYNNIEARSDRMIFLITRELAKRKRSR